jgi:hypothetical protein
MCHATRVCVNAIKDRTGKEKCHGKKKKKRSRIYCGCESKDGERKRKIKSSFANGLSVCPLSIFLLSRVEEREKEKEDIDAIC